MFLQPFLLIHTTVEVGAKHAPVPAWGPYPWASKGYERLEAILTCLYYAGIMGYWAAQPQNPLVLEIHPVGAPLTEVRGVSS